MLLFRYSKENHCYCIFILQSIRHLIISLERNFKRDELIKMRYAVSRVQLTHIY